MAGGKRELRLILLHQDYGAVNRCQSRALLTGSDTISAQLNH